MSDDTRKRLLPFLHVLFLAALASTSTACGAKGTTRGIYKPPAAPLAFSLSRQTDGLWTVSAGLVTPYGTFAIEREFDMREDFTYIVFRDKERGTDQVFKVGNTGYIEVQTKGEHRLNIQQQDNQLIIDVISVSGTLDFTVFPETNAVATVDLGKSSSDIVIYNDHHLLVDHRSIFLADDHLALDSIEEVLLTRDLGQRQITFKWKKGIDKPPLAVNVNIQDLATAEANFALLKEGVTSVSPHIQFKQKNERAFLIMAWIVGPISGLTFLIGCFLLISGLFEFSFSRGCLGYFLFCVAGPPFFLIMVAFASDPQIASTLFRHL